MNKPNYLYLLVVLLSLVFATSAYAQPEIKAQSSLSQILGIGGVKEELGLSGDQYEALSASAWQIKSELEKVVKEYKDNFIPRLSDDKKAVLQYELEAGIKEIQANEIERLEKVLSSDQIQRLKQIRFQY